jgi:hypothetical protein
MVKLVVVVIQQQQQTLILLLLINDLGFTMNRSIESPITLKIKREAEKAALLSNIVRGQLNLLFYPGFIAMFPFHSTDEENPIMMSISANWMLCDGSSLDVEEYPELYEIIGNKFGGNSSKFNIPNYGTNTYLVGASSDGDIGFKSESIASSTSGASVLNGGTVSCSGGDGSTSCSFAPTYANISFTDTRTTQMNRLGMYYYIKVR